MLYRIVRVVIDIVEGLVPAGLWGCTLGPVVTRGIWVALEDPSHIDLLVKRRLV